MSKSSWIVWTKTPYTAATLNSSATQLHEQSVEPLNSLNIANQLLRKITMADETASKNKIKQLKGQQW